MKTVGIITMHKVWNAGSALQAYALQRTVEDMGFAVKLIDYQYPNIEHSAFAGCVKDVKSLDIKGAIRLVAQLVKVKLMKSKHTTLYNSFYDKYFRCTKSVYTSRKSLYEHTPLFDIYITGSDQVWNPQYIGFDTSYLLDFVPENAKRISYASSFSTNSIPFFLKRDYARCLSKYDSISVREESGKQLVNELTNKDATVCCDPTLLLSKEQWGKIAEDSVLHTGKKYILVYVMGYAYDPYPSIYKHIDKVANELKLPVVFFNSRRGKYNAPFGELKIQDLGPAEFLWLFKNASFVMTDSFHGTAFSLNFQRPFISVIKEIGNSDSRVYNILKVTNTTERAVVCDDDPDSYSLNMSAPASVEIEKLRNESIQYLYKSLA
ncbi:MAG: polysaccharide pyruvyl transferase family protein [Bacteroides sp.]|nr:polysaccharide pyruvyl transferase family protein [Lachnospiraceae bacterium]MCM1372620.1 polysaccharide pyruvyl transferase family protein [Bacteroides sp.]MCM1447165.1 polysaccharide pyruvyl transferase family protein [Bacteroides sp.]